MKKTPLYEEHLKLNAKMVPFAGWEMPVQYAGLVKEHEAVRTNAGLFDVSHMGEFEFGGSDALPFLNFLTANNVAKLVDGQAQYSLLCNKEGGIVDDILVYRLGENEYWMVVNASNIEKDWNWINQIARETGFKNLFIRNSSDETCLIALQGPKAKELLDFSDLKPFHFKKLLLPNLKNEIMIARTGYTGEEGVEIFCKPAEGLILWRQLIEKGATPTGLGARDTLRLEACLSLYGHEITDETNPFEAGLSWVVKMEKENFVGKDALAKIRETGLKRKLVGFQMIDKGIAREHYKTFSQGKKEIGYVTSGSYSPTSKQSIGLAYLPITLGSIGTKFNVDIRGTEKLAEVVATPFYKKT